MASTKVNQKIHIDTIQDTLSKLDKLDAKPKDELTLRESITLLSDKLHSALKKGYSYQDLAELLEQQKILITATTLKQYLSEIDKEKRGRKVRTKTAVAKQSTQSDPVKTESSPEPSSELSESPDVDKSTDVTTTSKPDSVTPAPAASKTTRRNKSKAVDDLSSEFNQY
ncbi:MAG: hypothetical protein H0X31_00170 [Nostocaceae cyanobacterium]|nr:hypothetical protein [Nostocaceae cyanobacterium]